MKSLNLLKKTVRNKISSMKIMSFDSQQVFLFTLFVYILNNSCLFTISSIWYCQCSSDRQKNISIIWFFQLFLWIDFIRRMMMTTSNKFWTRAAIKMDFARGYYEMSWFFYMEWKVKNWKYVYYLCVYFNEAYL